MTRNQRGELIRRELDRSFEFLNQRPSLHDRIMDEVKGETVMKKKMSVSLALALVLLLVSVAALAATLSRRYFEEVAQIHFESGYYDDWGWPEKQTMVRILRDYDLLGEEEAAGMTSEDKVDAYMIDRYGVNGRSDTIGLWAIMEKELGPENAWPLEQKAWYSQMLIDIGLLTETSDDGIYAMPAEGDIAPQEAAAIARAAVMEAYGLQEKELDSYQMDISFETHASDWKREKLHYEIVFRAGEEWLGSCAITRDGRVMDSTMGEGYLSPQEQAAQRKKLANDNDQEAIELLQEYVQAHELWDPFLLWPLEHKKALTDQLRPVILENMAQNPDYNDQTRVFWATHLYGLPDDKAISQTEAERLAREQLTRAFGLTDEQARQVDTAGFFYDVTDTPQWKVSLAVRRNWQEAKQLDVDTSKQWRVVLDAYTGEVLETCLASPNDNTPQGAAAVN